LFRRLFLFGGIMRKKLAELKNQRKKFTGIFERFGTKRAFRGSDLRTVLLVGIRNESGELLCDHLWFNYTKGFERIDLVHGDIVEFEARVKNYTKGYMGHRDDIYDKPIQTDYRLDRPTKIKKIGNLYFTSKEA
jgi:hypothetical protein